MFDEYLVNEVMGPIRFDVCSFEAKILVFEFDYPYMNMFEFI